MYYILRGDGDSETTVMWKVLAEYLGCYQKSSICFVNFTGDSFELLVIKKYIKVLLNFDNSLILHPLTFFQWV